MGTTPNGFGWGHAAITCTIDSNHVALLSSVEYSFFIHEISTNTWTEMKRNALASNPFVLV